MRNRNGYRLNKILGLHWPPGLPKYLAKPRAICHFFIPKDLLSTLCVPNLIPEAGDRIVNKMNHMYAEAGEIVLSLINQSLPPPKKVFLNSQTQFSATQM